MRQISGVGASDIGTSVQRLSRVAFWLLTLMVLMLGLGARTASATVSWTGTAQTVTLSMPTSVTVPRDAAVGTVLTFLDQYRGHHQFL